MVPRWQRLAIWTHRYRQTHTHTCLQSTVGKMTMKLTRRVLGHLLICSLVCSRRYLICLLSIARFARALCCAYLFARSLTHLVPSSWESGFCLWIEWIDFIVSTHGVLIQSTYWVDRPTNQTNQGRAARQVDDILCQSIRQQDWQMDIQTDHPVTMQTRVADSNLFLTLTSLPFVMIIFIELLLLLYCLWKDGVSSTV